MASLSLILPSQSLSWAVAQATTQKLSPTFTEAEAMGVHGSGKVSAHLVKFSPRVFPQMSDISRATSIPDIAPLCLLSHTEFGPGCAAGGGSPELLSWQRVNADGKESGLSGSGRILHLDFSGNKISSIEHVSELYIISKPFPVCGWI